MNGLEQKNIKDRFTQLLSYLNIGQGKFERITGIGNGTINNIKDGISTPKLKKILQTYPDLNIEWLITGEGDMLKNADRYNNVIDKEEERVDPISSYSGSANFKLIPLHSFDVAGGSNNQEADTMGYVMGYMPFVNAKEEDIAVLVTGNSMYPTYPAGSYVQIRKINYWKEFLEFGQVHIIELMDDRRLIKEIRKGSDKDHLRLISHNENFDEVEISIDFVRSVWLVLAKYEKSVM